MKTLAIAIVLAGCAVDETTSTGPEIHVTLSSASGTATDTDSDPHLDLDTTGSSAVTLVVEAIDGTTVTGTRMSASPAASATATLALPGVTIPDSTLVPHVGFGSTEFDRAAPITLPPTAVGKTLAVHVVAVDGNGLHSNVIDLNVALRMF